MLMKFSQGEEDEMEQTREASPREKHGLSAQ